MIDDFAKSLALVLVHEGGYVDLSSDPGGATSLGITIGTLSAYLGRKATKDEVKALTVETATEIYRALYWAKIHGDDLPSGLSHALFDFAVNSGPARAVIALQRILGVADDGILGPVTLAAIKKGNTKFLVRQLCAVRLTFLQRLSTWGVFGKGWTKRVRAVESEALRMADAPVAPLVPRIVDVELVSADDDTPLIFPVAADVLE